MSPKYVLIDTLFGRVAAKRTQLNYNAAKTSLLRSLDRFLSAFGRQFPDDLGHAGDVATASQHVEACGNTPTR
jgi:hypothetical protein